MRFDDAEPLILAPRRRVFPQRCIRSFLTQNRDKCHRLTGHGQVKFLCVYLFLDPLSCFKRDARASSSAYPYQPARFTSSDRLARCSGRRQVLRGWKARIRRNLSFRWHALRRNFFRPSATLVESGFSRGFKQSESQAPAQQALKKHLFRSRERSTSLSRL